MATMRLTVKVCDVCKDPNKPAQRYYMTLPGLDRTGLDLCVDDAKALESYREFLKAGKGRRSTRRVSTPEEVERLKQKP